MVGNPMSRGGQTSGRCMCVPCDWMCSPLPRSSLGASMLPREGNTVE